MRKYLSASFVLCLALLGISELFTRVFFVRSMSGRFEYGYHPTAGFQEKADGSVALVRAGGRRFRPQTFSQNRPRDLFRVMVVGDSVPRGSSLESAYPWLIAEQLRTRGVPAEGVNLGVAGYGTHRNLIVLRAALKYHPSLVVLHVNNSNEYEDEREFKRSEEFKSWHPKNWLMKSLVIRRLYEAKTEKLFWEWLPTEIRARQGLSDADAEIAASLNEQKLLEWDERVRRYTAESTALARDKGIPIVLVTQARFERDARGEAVLDDHGLDTLAASLTTNGVYRISMKQLFKSRDLDSLFADSAHLRPAGHEIMATAIVNVIESERLLEKPLRQ